MSSNWMNADAIEFVPSDPVLDQANLVLSFLQEVESCPGDRDTKCQSPKRRQLKETCRAESLPVVELTTDAKVQVTCVEQPVRSRSGLSSGDEIAEDVAVSLGKSCMGRGRGNAMTAVGKGLGSTYGGAASVGSHSTSSSCRRWLPGRDDFKSGSAEVLANKGADRRSESCWQSSFGKARVPLEAWTRYLKQKHQTRLDGNTGGASRDILDHG